MVSYASSLRAYAEQRAHLADLRADIATARAEIAALRREKRRWEDPAYIRAQARERFGWVLPGEIAFQVLDENGEPLAGDDSLPDPPEPEQRRPVWWQAAWRSVEAAGEPGQAQRPEPARSITPPPRPRPSR